MIKESDTSAQIDFAKAVALSDTKQIQDLLLHGFNVNARLGNKGSALHVAVKADSLKSTRLLLEKGV